MHMAAMEYIQPITTAPQTLLEGSRKQVEDILKLHSNGYMFGDLRMQNIPVDLNGTVRLIDFSWCGTYDPDVFPPIFYETG